MFTNRRISFSCEIYLVSYGFLWLSCAYKSQENHLAARFTWFLMVSYGLSVPAKHKDLFALTIYLGSYKRSLLTNHNKWIWLHDLPGFLWFPMAHLCLQMMRNCFAYNVHIVSNCLSVVTNHEKLIWLRNLPGFLWFPMAYRCLQIMEIPLAWTTYLVSCWLSVLPNHKVQIWLHDLPGFLWFPMAYR